jgi:hypothetical protein
MKDIHAELVRNNRSYGLTNCNLVRVESDACYNNPLFSTGTTPFQAGTQVTYSMIENNTTDKKIVYFEIITDFYSTFFAIDCLIAYNSIFSQIGCT